MPAEGFFGLPMRARGTLPLQGNHATHDRRSRVGREDNKSSRPSVFARWYYLALALVTLPCLGQTSPGTVISNQALVSYTGSSGIVGLDFSNQVDITTLAARTPSTLEFTRVVDTGGTYTEAVGPAACRIGSSLVPLADPVSIAGMVLDPATAHALIPATTFHVGEAVFLRLTDRDQNVDPNARDFALVTVTAPATGDSVEVSIIETAVDSGVFSGHVPTAPGPASAGDCVLQAERNAAIDASYVDIADSGDTARANALLDPISRVFDARTGALINGARVTLIDMVTGQLASPIGDDGVSSFPATITVGGVATDTGGTRYEFGPGEFRFPIVPVGSYRLQVDPPLGYLAPSGRSQSELQALAGGPFTLDVGSFGQEFSVGPTPFVSIDIPIDPTAGALFLDKRSSTSVAAPGDFVEYQLTLTHADGLAAATDVVLEDYLPLGLRYQPGSARVTEPAATINPQISDDGRVLSFSIGNLESGTSFGVTYVAAVVPGAVGDEIVNRAQARSALTDSNEAAASLRLIDDLFRNESFLAGRVALGTCMGPRPEETEGLAGVRVYLEDGRFAVSDEGGRFHFEGLQPGTHIVQLDLESMPGHLELESCDGDLRFAGTDYSRFVELRPGALERADFFVRRRPPPSGAVMFQMQQDAQQRGGRDIFNYQLDFGTNDSIRTDDVQVMLMLPSGFSADDVVDATGQSLEARVSGDTVTVALGSRQGPWLERLWLTASADQKVDGDLRTRGLVRFNFDGENLATPVAETNVAITPGETKEREYVLQLNFDTLSASLSVTDRATLDSLVPDWRGVQNIELRATGHTDAVPISVRSRSVFADNYALSEARAEAVVEHLREALVLGEDQISYRGQGPDAPIADNQTAEGRHQNRRVALQVTGVARATDREVLLRRAASAPQEVAFEGQPLDLPEMTTSGRPGPAPREEDSPAEPDIVIESLEPGLVWLWPAPDYSPPIPNAKVVIQHAPNEEVELTLNDEVVSPLNFEGVTIATDQGVAISRWRGLDLVDGPNELVARVTAPGSSPRRLERHIHFAGPPVRGELLEELSVLVADGNTRPTLVVRFVDRWGRLAREGSIGQFSVEPPYRSWWEVERLRENPILLSGDKTPLFTVGEQGVAQIELEPSTLTGEVMLNLSYTNEQQQDMRTRLKPSSREWILVGMAEGTLGHRTLTGAMDLANASGLDSDYYQDGRLAFYAKGRVKGSLLTAAFDTDGERNNDYDAFGGVIDPDRYYTLYGDNTEQRFDAASREKLYVKIERDTFLAMIGDYETGLTITDLARYNRTFTGFHSELHGDRVNFSAFAARANQAFIKDELLGDGTSGPYQLSRNNLLAGSDKITIESRDRFRPDLITATRALRRHFDYDIDYSTGAIFFREPIASRDFDFNPIFVVVDYETRDKSTGQEMIGGGRAAVSYGPDESEVGVTWIEDGTAGAAGRMVGTDLRHFFTENLELKVEFAETRNNALNGAATSGAAHLLEIEHRTGRRQIEAYWRETDLAFGLGQQRAAETGTERAGAAMRNELSDTWLVETEMFRQENQLDGATRTVLEGESRYQDDRRTASMGLRRVDEDINSTPSQTNQAFVGGTWRFFDQQLTTRANFETELSGRGQSIDYPTRTLLGVDVALSRRITVFGEHEIADGDLVNTAMTRLGVKANPTDRSQFDTSVSREMTEFGPRSFANLGMFQGFTLGERWTVDFGGERSALLAAPPARVFDARVPPASGNSQGDFTSGFFGLGFRAPDWSFTSRLEYRDSDTDKQQGLIGGFYRERTAGRGFSAELRLLDRRSVVGSRSDSENLRVGWAYRPADSRWIILDRADWIGERRIDGPIQVRSQRVINNFNAHFALDRRQEIALQYAVKSVRSNFAAFQATGVLDLFGIEWRRRIDQKFDFGVHTSLYRALDLDVSERGWGIDVGMNMSKNLNVVFGYNFTGFEDEDFSRARYTGRGPFVQFRLKVDQASLKDLLGR